MVRYYHVLALIALLIYVGIASAQDSHPIMKKIAHRVIQKYETSSCEQSNRLVVAIYGIFLTPSQYYFSSF
jgi:hypothetical protein